MKVVDFHCDVLCKLLLDEHLTFQDSKPGSLDVTYERLKAAGTVLQTFAIYIPESLNGRLEPILESVDRFYQQVLACKDMMLVRSAQDLELCLKTGKIGALLSLEGVDGLQGQISMLRILQQLGIRAAGLTWNHANWAADGAMEPRGGGLTAAGRRFVEECNKLDIMVDVSHLSERAFWDVAELSQKPFLASHSNARAICDHPRNLNDRQIVEIINKDGMLGITFVPWFVSGAETVVIDDLLRHIEHICELGGEKHIMLGSDFDGIDRYIGGLSHPGELSSLTDALLKRYTSLQTEQFMSGNALRFLRSNLPVC
ncbi:membrane dipeptidase [Paenibacillus endophyticus]|uniref:Membrane dipeptidase n=1 Tax=Paenibacillus endophyticus TaxID=1294268 RepID=A0A7W5C6F7_9BACL|nr:dipeptidase [Paenibacillus endophyticus]MBB3152030.1 membrane dipeptidase [Paenibacillus endophyticus]